MTFSTALSLHRELLGEGNGPTSTHAPVAGQDVPPADTGVSCALEALDHLEQSGRALRFRIDPHTGRVCAHVLDGDGRLIHTIGPRRILELAAGASSPDDLT